VGHDADNIRQLARLTRGRQDHWLVRWTLIALAVGVIGLLVVLPLVNVFYEALKGGVGVYWTSLASDSRTRQAIALTLTVVPIAVGMNVVFGVAAAWCIARFRFPGRTLLLTLIDLPFSVSPVVVGLALVLIFGTEGYLGPWLEGSGFRVLHATPGIVLATAFVTFPFVARELIPVLEAVGPEEELAAVSLGARGWDVFRRVTLPNVKWGLIYGVILCTARAAGEFGAVYVVSGHVEGVSSTSTMPIRVNRLFEDGNQPGAFALASVLTLLAVVTLILKVVLEKKARQEMSEAGGRTGGVSRPGEQERAA
jgi:sulfate/thiosulfate transport system permease protein